MTKFSSISKHLSFNTELVTVILFCELPLVWMTLSTTLKSSKTNMATGQPYMKNQELKQSTHLLSAGIQYNSIDQIW